MADQGRVILFLVISVIALWGIVISLAAVHIVEFLKKRVRPCLFYGLRQRVMLQSLAKNEPYE